MYPEKLERKDSQDTAFRGIHPIPLHYLDSLTDILSRI